MRANTIQTYSELNRRLAKAIFHQAKNTTITDSKIGQDSLIGDASRLDEKCSVKKSVIGAHCIIGKNVKIVNSIIMDNVVLEDKYT